MNLISKNQSQNQSRQNLFYLPKKKAKGNQERISFLDFFFQKYFSNLVLKNFFEFFFRIFFLIFFSKILLERH